MVSYYRYKGRLKESPKTVFIIYIHREWQTADSFPPEKFGGVRNGEKLVNPREEATFNS